MTSKYLTMKRLLMLGGGFLQKYVISKAKDLGYYVLCLDADPNAVGFKIADEYAVILNSATALIR